MDVGNQTIELSHEDKVLFPGEGYTKRDLAEYYQQAAEHILRHAVDRPVVMHRYPDGINGEDFFHKDAPDYFPSWIRRITIPKKEGGSVDYVVCTKAADLVYLANQACITPHVWLSRVDNVEHPDRLIIDFDPPGDDFAAVRSAAKNTREILEDLGLAPHLMTTGSRGAHVLAPLRRGADFDTVRAFARRVAELLVSRHPDELTTQQHKSKRGNRVFIDANRNGFAQTAVAPYAVRGRPGAPVAVPLNWDELSSVQSAHDYTIKNVFRRLGQTGDPWQDIARHARDLPSRADWPASNDD